MGIIDKCDRLGENILRDKGINSLPIDVKKIAQDAEIILEPFPEGQSGIGYAGMLLHRGNQFAIFYSTRIASEGFQRFTIAHELGHYFIEGHPEAVLDANGIHKSREPFSSNDSYERQADSFAAGLLMPSWLCQQVARRHDDGLDPIIAIADACNTSLMASAIRYVELSKDKVAILVSQNGKILFSSASPAMLRAGFFVKSGTPIPANSLSATCSSDSGFIRKADTGEQESDLSDWSVHDSCLCYEQVKGLGATGKLLTVLVPQEEDDEDQEESGDFELRFRR